MSLPYLVHAGAGALAIGTGFTALFASKGGSVHRRVGVAFVATMLALALSGVGLALVEGDIGSLLGGALAAYLVATGMITVQRDTTAWRRAHVVAAAAGGGIAAFSLAQLPTSGSSTAAVIFFTAFATVAGLAVWGDVRILRQAPLTGTRRLTRHLWRMGMALWIATASFFLGPRRRVLQVLPDAIVVTPVVIAPVLVVLLVMGYWIWRLRARRGRGLEGVTLRDG